MASARAQTFRKITSPAEWDEITARVQEQFQAKQAALKARVDIALMCPFFGGTDSSLPVLTIAQSCEIAEMFATGEYVRCEFLLKEHGL